MIIHCLNALNCFFYFFIFYFFLSAVLIWWPFCLMAAREKCGALCDWCIVGNRSIGSHSRGLSTPNKERIHPLAIGHCMTRRLIHDHQTKKIKCNFWGPLAWLYKVTIFLEPLSPPLMVSWKKLCAKARQNRQSQAPLPLSAARWRCRSSLPSIFPHSNRLTFLFHHDCCYCHDYSIHWE